MAGKALAAFSLLATLLQAWAQINCYPNYLCGDDQSNFTEVPSAKDCCLENPSTILSYVPTDGSAACQLCYVVGFNKFEELSMKEEGTRSEGVGLSLLLPPNTNPDLVMNITFQINQNLSSATLGDDFTLGEINATTQTISRSIESFQEFMISIETINDDVPGEKEQFVLEMISAQITSRNADPVEVFANNSLIVVIVDNDVLEIQFHSSEIPVDEHALKKEIQFIIANPINVDTHFRLLALTYKQYTAEYDRLKAKYPNLPKSTLTDGEYDQAELEDFTSREILFTVKANTTETEEAVVVYVVDDGTLEPREEGFRLVIVVDENFTSRDLVRFGPGGTGRQVALFRIDDYQDEFHFGFVNEYQHITEMRGTTDLKLPLHVAAGNTTEYTIIVTFAYKDSNATSGEDFIENLQAQIKIDPPRNITPNPFFDQTISGDVYFEPEEHIVIEIEDPELEPIEPYDPMHDNISPPDPNRIVRFFPRTTVIIESDPELILYLNVPKVVREGESLIPNANVTQLVRGMFQLSASDGTATVFADYSNFSITIMFESSVSVDADEVKIAADNLVEPNETFNIMIELVSPEALRSFLTVKNSPEVVTIIDNNTATIGFRNVTLSVDEDAGVAVLTVAVLGFERLAMNAEVRVSFSTMNGTADGQDFGSITDMELVFNDTQQEIDVTVAIIDNIEFEDLEMFTANLKWLSSNVQAEVSPSLATISIVDTDRITIGFTVDEKYVNESDGTVTLEVSVLSGILEHSVVVGFQTAASSSGNLATSDADYVSNNGTLSFDSNNLARTITINIQHDSILEYNEIFQVDLTSDMSRVTVSPSSATVTILDDDEVIISFEKAAYEFAEDSGSGSMTVVLTGELERDVAVLVSTSPGTASAGADYTSIMSRELVFNSTVKTLPLTLNITVDEVVENDETLSAALTRKVSSDKVLLNLSSTDITITNDDFVVIGFEPISYKMSESSRKVNLMIRVFSGELNRNVEVILDTYGHGITGQIDGSAMDLIPISQQIIVFNNTASRTVTVSLTEDLILETDELFFANLSVSPTEKAVVLNNSVADITILNDDMVQIGFDQLKYEINEDDGFVDIHFGILNSNEIRSTSPVDVQFLAMEDPAKFTSDFNCGPPTTYTFTSKDTQFTVHCLITNDLISEDLESFSLLLTQPGPSVDGVTIDPSNAMVEVTDDDNVTFSFAGPLFIAYEGEVEAGVVVLKYGSSDYSRSITVRGTVQNGGIIDETLVFLSGERNKTVPVPLIDDTIALEPTEQYPLSLQIPSNEVRVELGEITNTILEVVDDDVLRLTLTAPPIVVENVSLFDISVEANFAVATEVTLNVFTFLNKTDGLAQEGEDYVHFNRNVTLAPEQPLATTITAEIIDDSRLEQLYESYKIRMDIAEQPPFAMIDLVSDQVDVRIEDDDGLQIGFKGSSYSVFEEGGYVTFEVEVKNNGMSAVPVDFAVTDIEGQAIRVYDYIGLDTVSLQLQPGQTSVQYNVTIVNDNVTEVNEETFTLNLQTTQRRVTTLSGFDQALVTVHDDDNVTIGFDEIEYIINEDTEVTQVCLRIFSGTLANNRNVMVTLVSMDMSATAPSDYETVQRTITLTRNMTSACVNVLIKEDDILEGDEIFDIVLDSNDPSADLHPDMTQITIVDNDGISVGFQKDQYFYQESDGQAIVTVVLTGDIAIDVVVTVSGEPSTQTDIGPDRVVYNDTSVTFAANDPKEQNVSTGITNDNIALEADEIVTVGLTIDSPASGVTVGNFQNTVVTIVDDDFVSVHFVQFQVQVNESEGMVEICVEKSLETTEDLILDLTARNGSAFAGSDYNLVVSTVTIPKDQLQTCFSVDIIDDSVVEGSENFFVDLGYSGSGTVSVVAPSTIEVIVYDDQYVHRQECILSDSLNLQTFSTQLETGHSFSMAEGCERKLVTTCDENVIDLEIRVDFFKDDFSSTKIAVVYEGETVIIDENLNLSPTNPPISEIFYASGLDTVSVSIPEIKLTITRNLSALTIFTDNTSLPLAGLCGDLNEQLLLPDCNRTVGSTSEADLNAFKASYKLKPSDQILRGERMECGITVNDTVIGDPLLTVPIHTPGYPDDLHLCYEIHGAADQYFNFISDECTSVNAHYAQAPGADFLNIIDSMSFVAVDNQHICRRISVDVANCSASVDGVDLPPMSRKRSISTYEENGISVRAYQTRVRVSVPNCADNSLVMWVFCQKQSFLNPYNESQTIGPIDMIKFEVTRGFNLKETSHGLLGQFWNIPMNVTEYVGLEDYYTVTVFHPSSPPRSFTGYRYDLTWEFEDKLCLYVGNRQGGPIGEVDDPNDSVIEGAYADYITQGPFMTDYIYAVFDAVCN